MNDYEFILFDRIEKIKQINEQYDLENNAYISFSGGKDSTILHHLIDLALPNNHIPRVFINTGIEYLDIVKFVKELVKEDDRFVIIAPSKNVKETLETFGYPFKSKEHSKKLFEYKRGSRSISNLAYKNGVRIDKNGNEVKPFASCPKILQYQYDENFKLKISHLCCQKLKKDPVHKWQRANNKSIYITGMRSEEGGQRRNMNCILTNKEGEVVSFSPLAVINEDFENWFLKQYNIKLCKLYYPPYNFERTGCKGCPFALNLQEQLDTMAMFLPNERKQCEAIWKPVYDEYRRIEYRLRKELTIYDFLYDTL